ncbi:MAG: hypothetical protein EZS28_053619, partial [Streblomastix strix]
ITPKIELISCHHVGSDSDIKLNRTDTTLDLSHQGRERQKQYKFFYLYASKRNLACGDRRSVLIAGNDYTRLIDKISRVYSFYAHYICYESDECLQRDQPTIHDSQRHDQSNY